MSTRTIHVGDGLAWLRAATLAPDHCIITSLPDISEVPSIRDWKSWFSGAAELCCSAVADDAATVFFQTDIKRDGAWIDKAHLVTLGANAAGAQMLWHKIVCRVAPGRVSFGRPAYAHLLAFSRELRLDPGQSTPDVIPELGKMVWPRAMGTTACEASVDFVAKFASCTTVVDPFCGWGSVLAVANRKGLAAVGVELSAKRAQKARELQL